MTKRPYIPLAVRLEAAIRQLGLDPATAQLDHDPALELRMSRTLLDGTVIYSPKANDPRYLVWRSKESHARKTNGPGGEKRITTRGGDHGDAAHLRALTRKELEFRRRLLEKNNGMFDTSVLQAVTKPKSKRKIPSRPFPKRKPA